MTAPALLPLTPLDWMRDASCADPDVDPELFFPMGNGESDGDQTRAVDALRVCHACPVQAKCLEFAESTRDDWAVLGGTTAKARRAQRRGASPDEISEKVARQRLSDKLNYYLNKGWSNEQIVARVGCDVAEVERVRARRSPTDRDQVILRAAGAGWSLRRIETELGVSRETARAVINRARQEQGVAA